jgi:hypothetical protein
MATSDKQIQANRRNAKLSTGPRTDDGKARSSMNGFKHPWLGVSTIMTEEDKLAMKEFVGAYIEDLAPLGAAEIQLAHTLAMDNWRLNRIKGVEENIFAWGYEMDPGMKCHAEVEQVENCLTHVTSYIKYADHINKISLYESRLNRIIVRNTELLNKRQADRPNRIKQPEAAPIAEPVAQTASAGAAAQRNQTLKPENGFAFTDTSGLALVPRQHDDRPGLIPTETDSQSPAPGQAA